MVHRFIEIIDLMQVIFWKVLFLLCYGYGLLMSLRPYRGQDTPLRSADTGKEFLVVYMFYDANSACVKWLVSS